MLEIRRAVYQDIPDIMRFIGRYYKKNHILARDRKFFEWQYVDRGKVNVYIAIDGNKVYAIEGFVIYNDLDSPDMTGSMWKSIRCEENTMVGIDVDQLLQEEIHPRYCYGTGYSSRTIQFHKLLGHEIIRLRHFYRLSDQENYKIARISTKNILERADKGYVFRKIDTIDEFKKVISEDTLKKRIFYKDYHYIDKRFFHHPIWQYQVLAIRSNEGEENAVVVARIVESQGSKCIKIVDYYGGQETIGCTATAWDKLMKQNSCEYVDIYAYGFTTELMEKAGFCERMEEDENIIPNYFEPFEQRNIELWMMRPEVDGLILMRGDGDQDRPC